MTFAVADPGEGHGEPAPPPPLFLDQTETRSAKKFFEGLDDLPPLSQGLGRALLWSLLVRNPHVNFIIKVYW